MPFTIGGDWIPSEKQPQATGRPVKVRKEKRRNSIVTVILNLPYDSKDLKNLAARIKKSLGCGGTVKNKMIELQGDNVELVRCWLLDEGIKSQ